MDVHAISPPITTDITAAATALRDGQLVGIPTETVYGLAARADDDAAVQSIFRVKGRPAASPLIVHVADMDMAREWVDHVPNHAERLATSCWPGPLTMILTSNGRAAPTTLAGGTTIALRVPNHPATLELIRAVGCGIAAPSANPHTRISPTTAEHVASYFTHHDVAMVLDGGPCTVGLESTIVDVTSTHPRVLRTGSVTATEIETLLGVPVELVERYLTQDELATVDSVAPGQSVVHYAPRARVVVSHSIDELLHRVATENSSQAIGVIAAVPAEKLETPNAAAHILLATPHSTVFARELYAALHRADALQLDTVHIMAPSSGAELMAIHDRITRASSAS